jgi:hypothetical protein
MTHLKWPDLIIEEIDPDQFRDWISPWQGLIAGRIAPIFMNKFGSWFLRRPEGHVEMLDVLTGALTSVADNNDIFLQNVNEQWWQEAYLFSELVYQLHEAGKAPGPGQCYALCPHPALGGPNPGKSDAVDQRFVMIMNIGIWQSLCAQALGIGR